jgi:hypothetical protein
LALISRFEERPINAKSEHDEVVCGYRAVEIDSREILQLETYGSPHRQIPEKVSQTIQLDRAAAAELIEILRRSFPGL